MERLPPIQDALLQHSKSVAYQAGIWCTSEQKEQHAPTPEGWGWTFNEQSRSWAPVWNTIPVASKACSELVKCSCKSQNGCGAIGAYAERQVGNAPNFVVVTVRNHIISGHMN